MAPAQQPQLLLDSSHRPLASVAAHARYAASATPAHMWPVNSCLAGLTASWADEFDDFAGRLQPLPADFAQSDAWDLLPAFLPSSEQYNLEMLPAATTAGNIPLRKSECVTGIKDLLFEDDVLVDLPEIDFLASPRGRWARALPRCCTAEPTAVKQCPFCFSNSKMEGKREYQTTQRSSNRLAKWYRKFGYDGPTYCKACSERFAAHLLRDKRPTSRFGQPCSRECPCLHCSSILALFTSPPTVVFALVESSRSARRARRIANASHKRRTPVSTPNIRKTRTPILRPRWDALLPAASVKNVGRSRSGRFHKKPRLHNI